MIKLGALCFSLYNFVIFIMCLLRVVSFSIAFYIKLANKTNIIFIFLGYLYHNPFKITTLHLVFNIVY